jgi:signal recognition particle subunit SEC65
MPFKKGKPRPTNSGRKKGSQNKFTKTVKETVLNVFNDLQNDPKTSLKAFAKKYPRDFYQISAKLIPTEIAGTIEEKVKITVSVKGNGKNS